MFNEKCRTWHADWAPQEAAGCLFCTAQGDCIQSNRGQNVLWLIFFWLRPNWPSGLQEHTVCVGVGLSTCFIVHSLPPQGWKFLICGSRTHLWMIVYVNMDSIYLYRTTVGYIYFGISICPCFFWPFFWQLCMTWELRMNLSTLERFVNCNMILTATRMIYSHAKEEAKRVMWKILIFFVQVLDWLIWAVLHNPLHNVQHALSSRYFNAVFFNFCKKCLTFKLLHFLFQELESQGKAGENNCVLTENVCFYGELSAVTIS